jgi:uncharacterized protein (TIGR00730 family)
MEQQQPRRVWKYTTGNAEIDAAIETLVAQYQDNENADLLQQMLTTCFRLVRNGADRGEMKLVNSALKEFAYSFSVFRQWRGHRKVSIFGSARTEPGDPAYEYAREFSKVMAERNWMVITGAGPGIMAAGHEGAGAEKSFGASIRLPLESEPNLFIQGNAKLINFKYFFTRKVTFIKESDGFALFPGGFGTLDEAFELLTLMQTGKSDLHPIVLLDRPGGTYWQSWLRFLEDELLGRALISRDDLALVKCCDSSAAAADELEGFYRNYRSQRWTDGTLVLRLQRLPPAHAITSLAAEFAEILGPGGLKTVDPSDVEVADGDELDCLRLGMDFNQESVGRLRMLIDRLNAF